MWSKPNIDCALHQAAKDTERGHLEREHLGAFLEHFVGPPRPMEEQDWATIHVTHWTLDLPRMLEDSVLASRMDFAWALAQAAEGALLLATLRTSANPVCEPVPGRYAWDWRPK